MTGVRALYTQFFAPLSPYRDTPNMPNWGLWHRVNDDSRHGVARIGCMAVWAVLGAAIVLVGFGFAVVFGVPSHAPPWPLVAMAVLGLFAVKVEAMRIHGYAFDPLDWLCDAGCWGVAGAYSVAHLLTYTAPDWRAYAALAVLWLIAYPWSTPR